MSLKTNIKISANHLRQRVSFSNLSLRKAMQYLETAEKEVLRIRKDPKIASYLDLSLRRDMGKQIPVTEDNLAIIYTPTVAAPCVEAKRLLGLLDPVEKFYRENVSNPNVKGKLEVRLFNLKRFVQVLQGRFNKVGVATDGTAILGLGDIGEAGLAVMRGKSTLLGLGGIVANTIFVRGNDHIGLEKKHEKAYVREVIAKIKVQSKPYSGIMMEDFDRRCFAIEQGASKQMDIPVFHDDQHATSMVVLAGLINAAKAVGKKKEKMKIVMIGAGPSGMATAKLLCAYGFGDIIVFDSKGAIYRGRDDLDKNKYKLARLTNKGNFKGTPEEAARGADVIIDLARAGDISQEMVRSMARDPVVFALSNPIPGILPADAKAAGARIIATGRSDFENQINNSLCFPGFTRAVVDFWIKDVTEQLKIAAAEAIARAVPDHEMKKGKIIPKMTDEYGNPNYGLFASVATNTARKAMELGLAKIPSKIIGIQEYKIENGELLEKRTPYSKFFFELTVKNLIAKTSFDMPNPDELGEAMEKLLDESFVKREGAFVKTYECSYRGYTGLIIAGPTMEAGFLGRLTNIFRDLGIRFESMEHFTMAEMGSIK
ncbi:MAG: hypothetical protein NT030_06055, partial [Candidatus Saganbacteria bacterium]|nr:hypothetical protein [Candidatus Saganbacteria bacterium]